MLFYPAQDVRPAQKRSYPYLVIRLVAAVYQREEITISEGRPFVLVGYRKSQICHPEPYDSKGQLTEGAKAELIRGVLEAVRRTNFRMCIVWGKEACTFVERDGTVNHSDEPPSGGYGTGGIGGQPLPLEIAFDQPPSRLEGSPKQVAPKDII